MKVKEDQMVPQAQADAAANTMTELQSIDDRLNDLQEHSQNSEAVALTAMGKIEKLKEDTLVAIESHVGGIEVEEEMSLESVEAGNKILEEGQMYVNDSKEEFKVGYLNPLNTG